VQEWVPRLPFWAIWHSLCTDTGFRLNKTLLKQRTWACHEFILLFDKLMFVLKLGHLLLLTYLKFFFQPFVL
jgi:hypothetical protein